MQKKQFSLLSVEDYEDGTIDFLFIDDDHNYEHVCMELKLWMPKIKKGGIIAGHDYMVRNKDFGVKQAVDEFFGKENVTISETSWVVKNG